MRVQCENVFTHEIGHSFTLAHFVDGTADAWGIAEEYPKDGTHVDTHPWAYDALKRRLRSWFRVTASGASRDAAGGLIGKNDPMNGGESSNAASCFPQYTPYHAWKAQAWAQGEPLPMSVGGVPGIYSWDSSTRSYHPAAPLGSGLSAMEAVDVPCVTFIGTLGARAEASLVYPSLRAPSCNVFELPNPFGRRGLPAAFDGAQFFAEVTFVHSQPRFALIAATNASLFEGKELRLFSFNVEASLKPLLIRLHAAYASYPNIEEGKSRCVL